MMIFLQKKKVKTRTLSGEITSKKMGELQSSKYILTAFRL